VSYYIFCPNQNSIATNIVS